MIQTIVTYLNAKLATLGRFDTHYCLTERRRREGDGATIPYSYTGAGEYVAVDIDNGSSTWWRGRSGFTLEPVTVVGRAVKQQQGSYPLRLIAILRRKDSTSDDGFMPSRLAEDIANVLNFENGDLRAMLGAWSVTSRATGGEYDTTAIWTSEFQTTVPDLDYKLCMVSVDVTIDVVADYKCWEGECETDPDILHLFNFCDSSVVARLTDEQRECLREALPTPCADADWSLTDTDGNELDSGSIPSGGSGVIVAPDGTVLRDGVPFGSVLSGGTIDVTSAVTPCADATVELNGVEMATIASGDTENIEVRQSSGATLVGSQQGQYWRIGDSDIEINGTQVASVKAEDGLDIPVIQDGSPVGSWNGTQWVIPSCPAGASVTLAVSDTSPNAGDTVTLTATPTGFTPTSYQFLLFNGSVTLLSQQSGNTYNWTVNVPAGNYSIYVLATDGATDVFDSQDVTVNALYLLGLYPTDCITDFAPFRLLGSFTGRIMEVRRLVGSTTTAVEIGFYGDYVTLDSPVLSVTVGSSSATTLGSFVNSSGYPNQDSLSGAQSAFVVRGYRQLNGALAWEQTVAANQPRLVDSGTLDVLGAFGCLRFLGNQWQDYGLISGANKPANYSILSVASFDTTGQMGLYGSRPSGSGQTPFSYGHIWKQPSGSNTITTLYGDGVNSRQATTLTSPIVLTSMQLFEDYKSSGVFDSDLYVDGSGPIALSGTGSALNVSGTATRMLFGRLGDLSGNLLTGRQLMFVVYEGNKSADRIGMKLAINSILNTSW